MAMGRGPDQLDVDIAVIHEFEMALLGGLQLLIGDFEFATRGILRHDLGEKLAETRGRGHVTVNVDDFISVVHMASYCFANCL